MHHAVRRSVSQSAARRQLSVGRAAAPGQGKPVNLLSPAQTGIVNPLPAAGASGLAKPSTLSTSSHLLLGGTNGSAIAAVSGARAFCCGLPHAHDHERCGAAEVEGGSGGSAATPTAPAQWRSQVIYNENAVMTAYNCVCQALGTKPEEENRKLADE